jgi:hypothetical protein
MPPTNAIEFAFLILSVIDHAPIVPASIRKAKTSGVFVFLCLTGINRE